MLVRRPNAYRRAAASLRTVSCNRASVRTRGAMHGVPRALHGVSRDEEQSAQNPTPNLRETRRSVNGSGRKGGPRSSASPRAFRPRGDFSDAKEVVSPARRRARKNPSLEMTSVARRSQSGVDDPWRCRLRLERAGWRCEESATAGRNPDVSTKKNHKKEPPGYQKDYRAVLFCGSFWC